MQIIGIVTETLEHVGNTEVEAVLKRMCGCAVYIAYMNNIQCDVYTYTKGTIIPEEIQCLLHNQCITHQPAPATGEVVA